MSSSGVWVLVVPVRFNLLFFHQTQIREHFPFTIPSIINTSPHSNVHFFELFSLYSTVVLCHAIFFNNRGVSYEVWKEHRTHSEEDKHKK